MKILNTPCILSVIAGLSLAATAQAQWYVITGDAASIPTPAYSLVDNGVTYVNNKHVAFTAPSFYTSGAYSGKSLKISLPATTGATGSDGKTTDRFEYVLVKESDPLAPTFWQSGNSGEPRYTGFCFRIIGSQSQAPTTRNTIIFQAWQGTPYNPPIWLDVRAPAAAGQGWGVRLGIHNDDTGALNGSTIDLYNSTLALDTWYRFVIGITPNYGGGGRVEFWLNGVRVVNYYGKIGYKPQSEGGLAGILDSMRVKFGAYRNRPNPIITLGFDDIRYGNTYPAVAP
jgi:Polysaccharide lyase